MATASALLGSYSPEDVVVTITTSGGVTHQVSGMVEGTFITVNRNVPFATLYTGSDNTSARVVRKNKSANISINLHQTGESNDVFTALMDLDAQDPTSGNGVFSIFIKDLNGRSLYHADQAFIGTQPDSSFAQEITARDWVIHAIDLQQFIGGNAKITPDTVVDLETLGVTVESRWQTT